MKDISENNTNKQSFLFKLRHKMGCFLLTHLIKISEHILFKVDGIIVIVTATLFIVIFIYFKNVILFYFILLFRSSL
jgi:hypothetical protein